MSLPLGFNQIPQFSSFDPQSFNLDAQILSMLSTVRKSERCLVKYWEVSENRLSLPIRSVSRGKRLIISHVEELER